ncbi:MAG: energy transducer TonB, partial [Terriglobia bacterium]
PSVRTIAPPKPQLEVHAGLFGGAVEPVTTKRPVADVQTGGFGNPQALPGHAEGDNPGNLPKLGSFGLPTGPGVGNGTGGSRGIQGAVASAGFGSGMVGRGNGVGDGGSGEARVTKGGFEKLAQVAPPPTVNPGVAKGAFEKVIQAAPSPAKSSQAASPAKFQPVEILSKPTPVYTEEARRLGIQGEVALSVVFEAGGALRILGVVKSLGHGLDQAAEQAATQIHFKAARRDGKPEDFPATLRIQFRLADQSS